MKSRNHLCFYINDKKYEIFGEQCFMTLADFLRYEIGLTGTKIVCAEGDCGACTVLIASPFELSEGKKFNFKMVNACILPLFAVDSCQIISVEALKTQEGPHPVQKAMNDHFASQCGYCTPGFVCAMASLLEDSILQKKPITEKRAKNYMTGNLCRCTGYDPIVKAALHIPKAESLQKRFSNPARVNELLKTSKVTVAIDNRLFLPTTLKEALSLKSRISKLRIVGGCTDYGVAINKGRAEYSQQMSLQNISSMWIIKKKPAGIEIPARVSLATLQKYIEKTLPEFDRMLNIFASPQIKNAATLVGNVVNASPIADTIPFLMVHDAKVEIQNHKQTRLVAISDFYTGYKKLDLKPNEIVTAIHLPIFKKKQILKLYKVSLRKDLDISAVTMAARFELSNKNILHARIAFGGVGPVVKRLNNIEKSWQGKDFSPELLQELAENISDYVSPISDVRGSKEYRLLLCRNLLLKMADELQ